jgi:serine/threonine protein kinase
VDLDRFFEGKLGEERVAVKCLESARQGKKDFLAEVETICSIEHINLVKLIGFCAEKFERLLVYEYMPRGQLDRWIYITTTTMSLLIGATV